MAMNFWEAQRKARSNTKIYVAIFLVMTLGVAILVEYLFRYFVPEVNQQPLPVVGVLFFSVTVLVALFQYMMYRSYGGSYVAESVGGQRVSPETTDPQERKLLNIVQEMAIAAAVPVPPVYILNAHAINAFAAGLSKERAAVAVTRGCLEKLSRQELQGVVAHEFGHIYNGDMVISLRLAAMVMGFFFVLYFGLRFAQIAAFQRGGRRSGGQKGGNPLLIGALLFMLAGAFTWLFGSILKAAVSREREYLADACAVQFTRDPNGIAGALKKIGLEAESDMPATGMAFSHMYFDNHLGFSALFATHPPLKKRIQAILAGRYDFEQKIPEKA